MCCASKCQEGYLGPLLDAADTEEMAAVIEGALNDIACTLEFLSRQMEQVIGSEALLVLDFI